MQNSGESEFNGERKNSVKLTLTFWQSFLLTLAGAAGLISLVMDGPTWIAITGFALVIALTSWLLLDHLSNRKK